jgi:Flp pilus assembly pilin Flp
MGFMADNKVNWRFIWQARKNSGQALVEYALILVLVALALAAALIATGPALGNVFSNAICGLVDPLVVTPTPGGPFVPVSGCAAATIVFPPNDFWETVTKIAETPPSARDFPVNPVVASNTPTATQTGTPGSPTPTLTRTPTLTLEPSPTAVDQGFTAPWKNSVNTDGSPISEQLQWRVDNAAWLGLDDWRGEYYPQLNFGGTAQIEWNADRGSRAVLDFNWGSGPPLVGFVSDNFSVRWTRRIENTGTANLTINVNAISDDGIRICLDAPAPSRACSAGGTPVFADWNTRNLQAPPLSGTMTLTPGEHYITVEYYDGGTEAAIKVDFSVYEANVPGDIALPSGAAGSGICKWTPITGSQPNTSAWAWSNAVNGDFNPLTRCNLELRGWVDLQSVTTPMLAFWDAWQLQSGDSVTLILAEYQPYDATGGGGPNWAAGTSIPLASGTTNFAWTNRVVPLTGIAGTSNRLAIRFQFNSGSGVGQRRFFLDDLQIDQMPRKVFGVCTNPDPYLCESFSPLDSDLELPRFITSGRWSLDGGRTANNSVLAYSSSANSGGNYVRFGAEQGADLRRHTIEFNGDIDLTTSGIDAVSGTGGTPDYEGNLGFPVLSFWHSYDLDAGESLEIQWTRDPRDATPDTWTTLSTVLPTTAGRVSQAMQEVTPVLLSNVPNWRTLPFRLRFSLNVNLNSTDGGGWWIDNIAIKREGALRYSPFPFCDFGNEPTSPWRLNGNWAYISPGRDSSGPAYTDSPSGNYVSGQETAMELKFAYDLANDTPENTSTGGNRNSCTGLAGSAAANPLLTFYHRRSLAANHTIHVDVMRMARTGTGAVVAVPWTNIWSYTYTAASARQLGWERVEVRLEPGILQAILTRTGLSTTWAGIVSGGGAYDDDFFIRIRLDTRSGAGSDDGIYIDDIRLENPVEEVHKLWPATTNITISPPAPPAGNGNGTTWVENFDSAWWQQFRTAASWKQAQEGVDSFGQDDFYSGTAGGGFAMTDSPPASTNYSGNTFAVLEVTDIIDLRGTRRLDRPMLSFWHKYRTGTATELRVQVAVEDAANTTQGYDKLYGYGAWQALPWNAAGSANNFINENLRNDGWTREQIDLTSYADDTTTAGTNEGRRIRLRFIVDSMDTNTNLADGWFLDDVRLDYRTAVVFNLPFADPARNVANWRPEGKSPLDWGLAGDLWRGDGSSLGSNLWEAYWFDCIDWMRTPATTTPGAGDTDPVACSITNGDVTLRPNTFFDAFPVVNPGDTKAWLDARPAWRDNALYSVNPTNAPTLARPSAINYDFNSTLIPPGAAPGGTNPWLDNFMARFERRITVTTGAYTFASLSDDAMRLRFANVAGGGTTTAPAGWNLLEKWIDTGRAGSFRSVTQTLNAGDYLLIMEYYENTGDALIQLQIGSNNRSFSDSPRNSNNDTVVNSRYYSNTSMVLNALVNLTSPGGTFNPRLGYYMYYDLAAGQQFFTEVSSDGGFTWVQTGLTSGTCPSGATCNPNQAGASVYMPLDGDWQFRSLGLNSFIGQNITFRFRLLTGANTDDGVWIADIRIDN